MSGSSGSLGKDDEADLLRAARAEDVSEEAERSLETSFRHLWSDAYSVDWKDTRRYPADTSAAPHRKLCVFLAMSLRHVT